jgi:hypothetical protein
VRDETVNAYRAMRDAAENVADAVRDVAHAQLEVQSAQLGVQDAEQNLKDVRAELGLTGKAFDGLFKKFQNVDFNPGKDLNRALAGANVKDLGTEDQLKLAHAILEVKQARLSTRRTPPTVSATRSAPSRMLAPRRRSSPARASRRTGRWSAAQQQSADASRKLADATAKANRLHKQGINGAPGVVSALHAVRDASQQVAEAQHDMGRPIPSSNLGAAATAADLASQHFHKLSAAEQGFLTQLNKTVKFLRGQFQPISDMAFRGITTALRALPGFLKQVGPGLLQVANSMAGAFGLLGGVILGLGPEFGHIFGDVAKLISATAPGIAAIVVLFTHLAGAVMPTATKADGRVQLVACAGRDRCRGAHRQGEVLHGRG